ncbi:MAG: TIGR01777 family oxidoreductase [Acidobacteria bacterium]|nr:TIGR01777 family oxidoreductase [Acidobacteriota bacterium]
MTILLAGGSGFLGRALAERLTGTGHSVRTLTRRSQPASPTLVAWQPDGTSGPWAAALTDADIVINLAGEGISDRRWTPARKQALRTSRLLPTRSLVRALDGAPPRPRLFINISAIGIYGAHGDEPVTEQTPPGDDFLAALCVAWEREASAAASAHTRVALVRTGIVLHPEGGALASMLLPFRMGVGGPMGTGRQFMSWIHLDDWVALVEWLATSATAVPPSAEPDRENVTAWNATAPHAVTNAEFARVLGRVLRRPAIMPIPGLALRLLLGEFATFLLTGARVIPERASRAGFRFRYPELEPALTSLLRPGLKM